MLWITDCLEADTLPCIFSYAGIATHYVPSSRLTALEDRLIDLETSDHEIIHRVIEEFVEPLAQPRHVGFPQDVRQAIDRYVLLASFSYLDHNTDAWYASGASNTTQYKTSWPPSTAKNRPPGYERHAKSCFPTRLPACTSRCARSERVGPCLSASVLRWSLTLCKSSW